MQFKATMYEPLQHQIYIHIYDGQIRVEGQHYILFHKIRITTGIQYIAIGSWLWDEKDLPI